MAIPDPVPTYTHLVSQIRTLYPNLAYLHSTEPHATNLDPTDISLSVSSDIGSSNNFIRELWGPRPFVIDGGFKPDTALSYTEKYPWDVVAFGRIFIANVSHYFRPSPSASVLLAYFDQFDPFPARSSVQDQRRHIAQPVRPVDVLHS